MLKNCPECDLMVSDKAASCPHCGYPLKQSQVKERNKSPTRRMRLPNGFGRITKISNGNLRNRYRVMVTVGKDEDGKFIAKLLKPKAYFSTYNEAYEALVEYHKNPCDLNETLTMSELFERWITEYTKRVKDPAAESRMRATFRYCTGVHDMRVCDVRSRHLKNCIEEAKMLVNRGKEKGQYRPASEVTKQKIKILFNMLFDYAFEYELVDKNYARAFASVKSSAERDYDQPSHIPFTDKELIALQKNIRNVDYADMVLIQCYTGFRPQELVTIKLDDVDIDEWFITGGMKTAAGKNRIVPIHPAIRDLIKEKYTTATSNSYDRLFTRLEGKPVSYGNYWHMFRKVIGELKLNPEHKPHDPRKTFTTLAKRNNVNEYILKLILGHAIVDVTEKYYTERSRDDLMKEMMKIPGPEELAKQTPE